jgi:hypothetical protein
VPARATIPPPVQQPATSAIAVDVGSGGIDVVVRGAARGAVLEVVWATGTAARVSGPVGSGFTYGGGRLEIQAASGDLRLELPRSAISSVEVDGRVYLARSAAGLTIREPAIESTDELVRFVIPRP